MKANLQDFLSQLSGAQAKMLAVLHKKQAILVRPDKDAIASIEAEEESILEEMQSVLNRREEILTAARMQNIHCDSIEHMCEHFFPHNIEIQKWINEIKAQTQQIQLLAYTNWTMTRKSLIHVSQILELLKTRGQGKTTYSQRSTSETTGGGFVDRVA